MKESGRIKTEKERREKEIRQLENRQKILWRTSSVTMRNVKAPHPPPD